MPLPLKNPGPLLVDKVRGYFDRLPPWLRDVVTIRVEKQKVDAKVTELDATALESELKQEVTDEKLRTNRFLGNGEPGSGNDDSVFPASHPSEVVISATGQVGHVTETISETETHLVEGPPLQDGTSEKVGEVWVTKKVEAPTFDKKAFQAQRDDLMPAEFRAAIPQKTTEHTVDGDAVMPTLSAIDLVKREAQEKVGVKTTLVQSRDTSGPTPSLIGQRIDPEFNGAVLNMTKDIVPDTSTITQVYGMTDAKVTPYDDQKAVKEIWSAVDGVFPAISLRNYDAELDAQIFTQVSVEAQGATFDPGDTVLDYQDRKIDAKHTLRVANFTFGTPAGYLTFGTSMVSFPALLSYISFQPAALATANRHEVQWVAGIRAAFTIPIVTQIYTTFYPNSQRPDPVYPYVWKPSDVVFKGVSYSINISNVLTDAWNGIGVSYTSDALYGNTVDRFNISQTSPSASNYANAIGTLQPFACTIEKYKRYWVRKVTYIYLQ